MISFLISVSFRDSFLNDLIMTVCFVLCKVSPLSVSYEDTGLNSFDSTAGDFSEGLIFKELPLIIFELTLIKLNSPLFLAIGLTSLLVFAPCSVSISFRKRSYCNSNS